MLRLLFCDALYQNVKISIPLHSSCQVKTMGRKLIVLVIVLLIYILLINMNNMKRYGKV